MSVDLALQKVAVAALKAALPEVSGRVFDAVPQSCSFPFCNVSEFQVLDDGAECIDGLEVFFNVHLWSRAEGRVEVATLAEKARKALHEAALSLDAPATLVSLMHSTTRFLQDPDGQTSHAVLSFKALAEA